jgi:amino acid transporter
VAVGFAGVFYTLVMFAQSLGFGVGAAGVKDFSTSGSPLGDLSTSYVGSAMAAGIDFGAMVSAFASALGTATGASRILFALGRDGFITRRLGDASDRTGSPANALFVIMVIAISIVIGLRVAGVSSANAFFYMGTIGVLSMLVAYIVIQIGAARFLHFGGRESPWRIIVIGLALAAIIYTLYKQVWPRPAFPYDLFPLMVAAWALIGGAITFAFPGLARRIGIGLSEAEGIRPAVPRSGEAEM